MTRQALLISALTIEWACGATPTSPTSTPSPGPTPSPAPAPAPAAPTLYHVSGFVRDDTGSPLPGLQIHLEYGRGSGYSNPESKCPDRFTTYCYLTTTTDAAGRYEATFDSTPQPMYGTSGVAGLVHTWREDYQSVTQLLPLGSSDIVQNLWLRRARRISAGETVTASIDPDSSLCTDHEDWFVLDRRCESIGIVTETAGRLTVDARASASGRPVPLVFFQTSGNYTTGQNVGSGVVSVGVSAGQRYIVMIGVPSNLAPQRYELTTTIQP